MGKFLDRFIQNSNPLVDPDSKFVFEHDKWDKQVADKIADEIKEYNIAKDDLKEITHTGHEAMVDSLYSLFKAMPSLRPQGEIRPSYLIDHKIMEVMTGLKEYEKFRPTTKGDPVNAGLAAVDLEPTLEVLFDQMEQAKQQAQQIEEMLQQGEQTEADIDALMEAAANAPSEEEAQDFQQQAAAMQEALEQLQQGIQSATEDLNNLLEMETPGIQSALKEALGEMNEKAEASGEFTSWGLNQGTLAKMNPQARIELSKKLGTDKFKRLANMIGKMQTLAVTKQVNKSTHSPDEIYDIEQGDAINRMLPAEALGLCDDILELDWMRKFSEQELQQYAIRGNETVDKGSIILLEDGSGSMMQDDRYIWAKAIGLGLLKIAFMQHRPFYGVQFGGSGKYCCFDFDTKTSVLELDILHGDQTIHYSGVEALVEYADKFLNNAGTDFVTPLSVALDRLNNEFEATGAVEADVVFLTDGQCGVPQTFLDRLEEERERLGFTIYGVNIGGSTGSEPMNTICDGKLISLNELTNKDMEVIGNIFGSI